MGCIQNALEEGNYVLEVGQYMQCTENMSSIANEFGLSLNCGCGNINDILITPEFWPLAI